MNFSNLKLLSNDNSKVYLELLRIISAALNLYKNHSEVVFQMKEKLLIKSYYINRNP